MLRLLAFAASLAFSAASPAGPTSEWAVADVQSWASGAIDSEVAASLAEHGITGKVLLDLDDDDWEEIGIGSKLKRKTAAAAVDAIRQSAGEGQHAGMYHDMWEYCASTPTLRKECMLHTPLLYNAPRVGIWYANKWMDDEETALGGFPHEEISWVEWIFAPSWWTIKNADKLYYGLPTRYIVCLYIHLALEVLTSLVIIVKSGFRVGGIVEAFIHGCGAEFGGYVMLFIWNITWYFTPYFVNDALFALAPVLMVLRTLAFLNTASKEKSE